MSTKLVITLTEEEAEALRKLQSYSEKLRSDPLFKLVADGNKVFRGQLIDEIANRLYQLFASSTLDVVMTEEGLTQLEAQDGEEWLVIGHFEEQANGNHTS